MGIDPGYRTGCKVAVVDETGKLLNTATIYPHPPQQMGGNFGYFTPFGGETQMSI